MPLMTMDTDAMGRSCGSEPLARALRRTAPGAPVIVMVHGYRYDPAQPRHSPHRQIFSCGTGRGGPRAACWPRRLGVGRCRSAEPLCIGFGWPARGTIWRAWTATRGAAAALARFLDDIAQIRGTPSHVIAHSMGARVTLAAMEEMRTPALGRAVLLTGAALHADAASALAARHAGAAEIVNVTSRENDLFDFALEAATGFAGRSIGTGLGRDLPGWLDLQIDAPATRAGLARLGFPTAAPRRRICHRSVYLRPGIFPLYRALLDRADRLPVERLRSVLPDAPEPRWSGFRRPGGGSCPVPQ